LDLKKVFGMNVRLQRTRLQLTQEELAERVGTDQSYLSQVERARALATIDLIARLAKALGVRPADLFDESTGKPPARR
jgi:transcriptional regulator with XRE-family HTH domain